MRFATALLVASAAFAQTNVLSVAPTQKLHVKRGESATVKVHAQLETGYHVNSDKPLADYLIPLKLTWKADPLEAASVTYPKPQMETVRFQAEPLSVFSGAFDIVTTFKAPAGAPNGPAILTGKLRYQACNDRICLRPATVEVPLTVEIQ